MPGDGALNVTRYDMQLFAFLGLYDQEEKLTFLRREKQKCKVADICFPHLVGSFKIGLSLLVSEIEHIALIYVCCHDLYAVEMSIRWFYIFAKAIAQTGRFYLII